jgi:hypothetical protein
MELVKNIQKYDSFVENNFRDECFFKDILVNCYKKKLLDDANLNRISYERLELLKVKLKYYTKDDSSSVMLEVAENIMNSIDYTIGIYLKTFDNIELIIEKLKNTSLNDMLKLGHDLIKKMVVNNKQILNKIQQNKLKFKNYSYNDTIDCGISVFFKEYNDFFAAHESPGDIDYQLHIDNMNYTGVEYINNYLYTLNLENEFCYKFDIDEINELLNGYDKQSELLLINIFELVLINSLGLIICGKSLKYLNISSIDREFIKNKLDKFSLEELQKALLEYADICYQILDIKDKALIKYIQKSIFKIIPLINRSIKLNKLETVFISFAENHDNEFIEYTDGKKLSNSTFRKLSEKIRECTSINEKLQLIKDNIKSLEDLTDMLGAECLFGDEYNIYFRSLSQMELILLSKYILDRDLDNEKEWCIEFNKHISGLNQDEQVNIEKIKLRIK